MSVSQESTPTTCRYCRSEIPADALKCPRCRSFLSRFSWARNATTELSLLSLAVSVLALSLPAIKALLPQRSDLTVSVLKAEGKRFEFMVSNRGNRPAAITQAGIEFPSHQNGSTLSNWVRLEESQFGPQMIEPEKSYRFSADVMSGLPPLQLNPGVAAEAPKLVHVFPENCSLKLVYVDFRGTETVLRTPYRCLASG